VTVCPHIIEVDNIYITSQLLESIAILASLYFTTHICHSFCQNGCTKQSLGGI